jgi:NADH-quinone oxidoreductase subunit L
MNTLTPNDYTLLLSVLLIPLLGYVVQIFVGRSLPRRGDWMLVGSMFVVMCITVYMFFVHAMGHTGSEPFWNESARTPGGPVFRWLYNTSNVPGDQNLIAGLLYDGLAASMLMAVGVVSFLVHLFSCAYMHGDRRYHIFFANISLFTFAMLGLILSDNLLFLFVFWELMGFMSYLLIGHFAHDPDSPRITHAAAACKKAFLTTRVGDTCLFFGMAMFYFLLPREYNQLLEQGLIEGERALSSFRFTDLWTMGGQIVVANHGDYPLWMTVAGFFTFGGTVGKSAQFPLHIWLPDAMEGPTPVSAMIHAATMVAAGVFLLGRMFPMMSPEVLQIVIAVGAFTALFAATIGCTVNDIKGVLAYSTISQLGFMVAAIGTGGLGLVAGLFHMVTHAFFKACLFLSAGSVIHGCHHEQNMQKMGGLRKKMPLTFLCMLICTLAIAGMPLFSGYYSKDRIIASVIDSTLTQWRGGNVFALVALPLAAMLTTFYMFRLIFLTFFGEPRDHHLHEHAHESPWPMTGALLGLASLGLFGGHFWLAGDPLSNNGTWFTNLVEWQNMYVTSRGGSLDLTQMNMVAVGEHAAHTGHIWAIGVSMTVLALGFFAALWIYGLKKLDPARITGKLGLVYEAVRDKYYIDEVVNATVVRGTMGLAKGQTWIDKNIVDGTVLGVGRLGRGLGTLCAWIDKHIVDGAANGLANATQALGSVARLLQTGRIQQYISFAVGGALLLAAFHILT